MLIYISILLILIIINIILKFISMDYYPNFTNSKTYSFSNLNNYILNVSKYIVCIRRCYTILL